MPSCDLSSISSNTSQVDEKQNFKQIYTNVYGIKKINIYDTKVKLKYEINYEPSQNVNYNSIQEYIPSNRNRSQSQRSLKEMNVEEQQRQRSHTLDTLDNNLNFQKIQLSTEKTSTSNIKKRQNILSHLIFNKEKKQTNKIEIASKKRRTLSDIKFTRKSNLQIFKFIYHEEGIMVPLIAILSIVNIILNWHFGVFCYNLQFDDGKYTCKSQTEIYFTLLRTFFNYYLGQILTLNLIVSSNFKYKYKNLIVIAFIVIVCIQKIIMSLSQQFDDMTITYTSEVLTLLYVIFWKILTKTPLIIVAHKMCCFFINMILLTIYSYVILVDYFQLNNYLRIILSNIMQVFIKYLNLQGFMIKLYYNVTYYQDLRVAIMLSFIMDQSIVFGQIIQAPIQEKLFVYFNFMVMIVYNITQFHLYIHVTQILINYLWKRICPQNLDFIYKAIMKLLEILQNNYKNILIYIDKEKLNNQNNNDLEQMNQSIMNEIIIQRAISSYYLLTYAYIFQYYTLIIIFNSYIPYSFATLSQSYYTKDLTQNDKKMMIDTNIFQLTLSKYFLLLGIFGSTVSIIMMYGSKKKKKFFSMMCLNKAGYLESTIYLLFFYYMIGFLTFNAKIQN